MADDDKLLKGEEGGFFQVGRDYEPAFVNHQYTESEKKKLGKVHSIDYLPQNSDVYKQWAENQPVPSSMEWDRWCMMALIGLTTGFVGFLLHQIIARITEGKYNNVETYIAESDHFSAWLWITGYSLIFVVVGGCIIIFWQPPAAGSGIPDVIAYLNGSMINSIFNIKTVVAKFFSCACAVGSGMPVGPEGPMIHLGAMIGAGVSMMQSSTLGFKLDYFKRFRNMKDKRDFVAAGAGAGVASAFGAPVGGLLFAMEEVSSFWDQNLGWRTFFCTMTSTFTTQLFNSAFDGFKYNGKFGYFKGESSILFEVITAVNINIAIFIPAIVCGVLGGFLGALFTFANLKICKWRARVINPNKYLRILEPCLIMVIMTTLTVYAPLDWSCTAKACDNDPGFGSIGTYEEEAWCDNYATKCAYAKAHPQYAEPPEISEWGCVNEAVGNGTLAEGGSYNQLATLMWTSGDEAIHHMFARGTFHAFSYGTLLTFLFIYFPLACWSAGTCLSSGLVVPMLLIGSLFGRIVGNVMVDIAGVNPEHADGWLDPGVFALIGAAAFFGGVSRLTMSLTVIIVEITNDVHMLLPIMVSIIVSKWIADNSTHSLYHALIEQKCITFLDYNFLSKMNLELFSAAHVMVPEVVTFSEVESVQEIAEKLATTPHSGFPVTFTRAAAPPSEAPASLEAGAGAGTGSGVGGFMGTISRDTLYELIKTEAMFQTEDEATNGPAKQGPKYEDIDEFRHHFHRFDESAPAQVKRIQENANGKYDGKFIDLKAYVNTSAATVNYTMSANRTYVLFRSMGLRHLTVLDRHHRVCGMITRKDLMGFQVEKNLEKAIEAATGKTFEHLHDHHGHDGGVHVPVPNVIKGMGGVAKAALNRVAGPAVEMKAMGASSGEAADKDDGHA